MRNNVTMLVIDCVFSSIAWFGSGVFTVMSVVDFADGDKTSGIINTVRAALWFIVGIAWVIATMERFSV